MTAFLETCLISTSRISEEVEASTSILHRGRVRFPGISVRSAEYVIVKEDEQCFQSLIDLFHDPKGWGLKKPEVIFSITGATKSFTLNNRSKKAFKKGLVKATKNVECWILTNGYCSGISKLVGEAVAENSYGAKVTVIGIVSKSVISYNESLEQSSPSKYIMYGLEKDHDNPKRVPLDNYHSHFIIIDNDCKGELGQEVPFRLKLEAELRKNTSDLILGDTTPSLSSRRNSVKSGMGDDLSVGSNNKETKKEKEKNGVLMCLICVNGGYDALRMIDESLKSRVPLLVMQDTDGTADLIYNTYHAKRDHEGPGEFDYDPCIEKSKILERRKVKPNYLEILEDTRQRIKNILKDEYDLITTWYDASSQELEIHILRGILGYEIDKRNSFESMKVIMQWNQLEMARDEIFTGTEQFRASELCELLEIALVNNKPEFVKLLIENGANLNKFLTYGRLYYFYNSKKIITDSKREPLYDIYNSDYDFNNGDKTLITFEKLDDFLHQFVAEDVNFTFLPVDLRFCLDNEEDVIKAIKEYLYLTYEKNETIPLFLESDGEDCKGEFDKYVQDPVMNLFLWAVLLNRIEIAKIFWQIGHNQIGNAIFGSILLNKMGNELINHELKKQSDLFESMAVGILNLYDASMDEVFVFDKMLKEVPAFGVNFLELASAGDRQAFLACTCVQNYLTKTWYGEITTKEDVITNIKMVFSFLSLGVLAPFLAFEDRYAKRVQGKLDTSVDNDINIITEVVTIQNGEQRIRPKKKNCCTKSTRKTNKIVKSYWYFYMSFLTSPFVIFAYESAAFFIFLMTFSYFLLCDFNYYYEDSYYMDLINKTYAYSNETNATRYTIKDFPQLKKDNLKQPSVLEYVLIFWLVTIIVEELRQLLFEDFTSSLRKKLIRYLNDVWNYLDISGCVFFFLGIVLRDIALLKKNEDLFKLARIALCTDLVLWFMRLLHFFKFFRALGPKLTMISKMVKDLLFFFCIMFVFVAAFGITVEATLKKSSDFDFNLFKEIINKAYWPIFGTIEILEDFSKISLNCDGELDEDCPEIYGVIYSYILLMVYVVVGNVLLINLLIAMFSSTFNMVQENSDQIWKFQRYTLVNEYVDAPIFPPPLCFLAYIYSVIQCARGSHGKRRASRRLNLEDANLAAQSYEDFEKKFVEQYLEMEETKRNETVEARLDQLLNKS